jgi:predicted nucleic acid-binding protein
VRFVDTNVLLCAMSADAAEADKSARAAALLDERDLALSVQVLQEFYIQATRPTRIEPIAHDTAVAFMATLERFPVQDLTLALVHASLEASRRWRISYWDAAIVEAAARGRLRRDLLRRPAARPGLRGRAGGESVHVAAARPARPARGPSLVRVKHFAPGDSVHRRLRASVPLPADARRGRLDLRAPTPHVAMHDG